MLKTLASLSVLCLLGTQAVAQNTSTMFSGQIVDAERFFPISFAHIVGNETQVIADADGNFSISVHIGDTLTFSHINFERYSLLITASPLQPIRVYMKKKENLMDEIIIRDYLLEEELKQEIVEHEVKYSEEEINAIQNVAFSTLLYKKGYVPEMNSLDNFKNYMKEPQGVSLFSSDPSKGLIKSIQRLSQQNKNSSSNRLRLNQTDTTTIYRFYVPHD